MIFYLHYILCALLTAISLYRLLVITPENTIKIKLSMISLFSYSLIMLANPFCRSDAFIGQDLINWVTVMFEFVMLAVLWATNDVWVNGCPYLKKEDKNV